eukprot:403359016
MTKNLATFALFIASTTLIVTQAQKCDKPDLAKIIESRKTLMDPAPQKGCVLVQHCFRGPDDPTMAEGPCPHGADPTQIDNPAIIYGDPTPLLRDDSKLAFQAICPFMDQNSPLCCNDDQVEIMTNNFRSIDSVFGEDCSICSVNLKRMWCDYTCHPQKTKFVQGDGYQMDPEDGNLTLTNFTVDPDYACTMFQSCAKVAIVAAASLQSSEAFLDFLGFNGKQQGKSIIKFLFSKDPNISLNDNIHPCSDVVPADGVFDQYANCKNCTCATCDQACQAPNVNAEIGFFDGFNGTLVGISYGALIAFSIIFQLVRHFCMKKKSVDDMNDDKEDDVDQQLLENNNNSGKHMLSKRYNDNNDSITQGDKQVTAIGKDD